MSEQNPFSIQELRVVLCAVVFDATQFKVAKNIQAHENTPVSVSLAEWEFRSTATDTHTMRNATKSVRNHPTICVGR